MAANNYLDTDFIEDTIYFLPNGCRIVFPRGDKSHWFFNKNCTWLIVEEKYIYGEKCFGDYCKIHAKKILYGKNPFLFLVGCAEKGFKAPFTSAALVDEKK